MMSEPTPEEIRNTEMQARETKAMLASAMMRKPWLRPILMPIRRLASFIERACDRALREDGWR